MNNNKTEKKTDWKRIGRIAVVCLPVVAVVLILAIILSTTVLFRVKNFEITGNKRYTTTQIIEATGLKEGKNMFVSNIGKAEDELLVKLPYIEEATIKRKLPNSMTVTVKESKEVYALNAGSEWYIVNADGKIIEILGQQQPEKGIAQVYTTAIYAPKVGEKINYNNPDETKAEKEDKKDEATAAPTPFEEFQKLLAVVNKTSLKGKIDLYNFIDNNNVRLRYDSRIKLDVGEPVELEKKLTLAAGALENEDKIDPEQKGTMDLTVLQQIHFYPEPKTGN